MTKDEATLWAEDNGYSPELIIAIIRMEIKEYRTNWSCVELKKASEYMEGPESEYTHHGYRKYTTDEYVPNAYRRNFGWKNTYYQPAKLVITIPA